MSRAKSDWVALLALTLIGLASFIGLRSFPIYTDESINLWWLWRLTDYGEWLRSLGDGKPLEVWPVVPLVWLGLDALTCMRALHVLAGIASVWLVYLLVTEFSERTVAFVSAVLTAICPWVVFYLRLTIADTYLCAAGMWVLYAIVRLVRQSDWRAALLLGAGLPLAAMAKLPVGFLFMAALPLALVCMPPAERNRWLAREKRKLLLAYAPVLLLLCLVLTVAVFQMQHGQAPGFGLRLVLDKTQTSDRLALFTSNLYRLAEQFLSTLTWPIVILTLAGALASLIRGQWPQRWLSIWSLASILLILSVSSSWGSRYYLFAIPPLVASTVWGWQVLLDKLPRRSQPLAATALLLPCIVYLTYQSALRVFDPPSARWSQDDWGIIVAWSSGYGYPELAQYLQSAPDAPPTIYTLDVGTAMSLRAYLPKQWQPRIQQLQIVEGKYHTPQEARAYLVKHVPAWLVTHAATEPDDSFANQHFQRIAGFAKPHSQVEVTLYRVVP